MAFLAINSLVVLFLFSLIVINPCLNSVGSDGSYDTLVSTQSSLPLQQSLDYYSFETKCKQKSVNNEKKDVLIVSTLDGKLSALDVINGDQIWSKALTSEPLLSSTISDFEITRKGRVVRVVPSLDGNLYLYNGQTIDGIPLNADTLLKSSYKLGDDLVITGGQESQISGIDILTGRVFYECGLKGCPSGQLNENETFDDLFLLKRITQTVRAIDPRNGRQKWFFSVTEPQLSETSSSECDSTSEQTLDEKQKTISENSFETIKETDFKIIVPNGLVSAHRYSSNQLESIDWSHRFDSPIVHVWHYRNGRLNALNLFDKQKLFGFTNDLNMDGIEPSVYIGLYRQQWYVQTSDRIKAQISETKTTKDLLTFEPKNKLKSNSNVLQIDWKPKAIVFENQNNVKSESDLQLVSSPQFSLSISSENDPNLGYYIFDVIEDNETKCMINSSEEQLNDWENNTCDEDNGIIEQIVIISSLSYYWREVTAISIISALILNFLLSFLKRKFHKKSKSLENEDICAKDNQNDVTNGMPSTSLTPPTPPTPSFFNIYNPLENNGFNSRYESDFEPIQVLGRGGFGLVFEAKHIIDESHYAVKRICLPFRKEQREKMMREVRALSKLDHSGIVRYYNAWVELPPPGWQEDKDRQLDSEDMTGTQFNELYHRNNQMMNKSVVSAVDNKSIQYKSRQIFSKTSLSFEKSKQLLTETKSNQSFDIVFDENYSSIKVIENNVCNQLIDSNICTQKTSKSNSNETERMDSIQTQSRPLCLNPVLPRCYLYIQMQLCRKDTLKDWLFNNSFNRDINTVLDIFDQIVSAVDYVHSMALMHRDLKPSNIFFSMNGTIKIGDFGLVTATAVDDDPHTPAANDSPVDNNNSIFSHSSSTHTNKVGTAVYMSPEQIQNLPYSHKVDIFSMGIILFELLVPFHTEMERNLILNNARKQIFSANFCQKYCSEYDLLKKLLALNPEDRPSTLEIKEHEVLKNLQTNGSVGRQRSRTISLSNGDHL